MNNKGKHCAQNNKRQPILKDKISSVIYQKDQAVFLTTVIWTEL